MTHPGDPLPPELELLDATLRGVELEPRASLGPEIANRFAAGERGRSVPRTKRRARWVAAAAALLLLVGAPAFWKAKEPSIAAIASRADRCCHDFDGGGADDDGLLVESVRGEAVSHLVLYEDTEHVGHWSPGAAVRYERLGGPAFAAPHSRRDLTVREFCCADYDGGRDVNDGVLVVLSGTDVVMAAVFERENVLDHVRLR